VDDGLTPLQRKMKEKLSGARFRWLNEQLYTTPGNKSFKLFQEKPELFDEVSNALALIYCFTYLEYFV
jgi:hypothetical protein